MKWRKNCRCGAPLNFSSEDIATGMPAEGCDFWCGNADKETGPHDFGVVIYENDEPKVIGVKA